MERDWEWRAEGQLIYAIIPDFEARRCEPTRLIGMMMTSDLAREAVNTHNKRRTEILVASMGSG